ncbi:MAG: acetate--CoA ligase family protein [Anaerolineae bacterium]
MGDSIEKIIACARQEQRIYLLEHECKAILRDIGVPTTSCLVAKSEEEAVGISEAIGYPVVLKILSPEIIHKSDAGGVKLNVGRGEVRGAHNELIARFKDRHVIGVSVQEMARPGLEVIVGATRDATFGPVLMFGLGGVFVEVLKDVSFRVIPVTQHDVQEMMEEVRGYRLLQGYRGQSADLASLRDILLKVSDLVAAYPAIKEVDLNPVFAYPQGSLVVDARMILEEETSRQLPVAPKTDLTAVFEPRSVAIIGASATPEKAGFNIVDNLLRLGYEGQVYPVNPKAEEILGLKAYPAVDQIPHQVETAVIATPSRVVVDVMRDCARKGVKAVIIISSGFSEGSEEGRRLEDAVMAIARQAGIRVVGPNTTGILNGENRFTSSFAPIDKLPSGNVAFIAQTGLFLGVSFEHILSSQHFGISKVAGLGNKADVDDADALEYLAGDAQTEVVAMYIEGLSDGRRFLKAAKEIAREKPIVVFKAGTTQAGAEAALSHTASLAGRAEVFEAACRQAGILRVNSFEEMLDVVKAFSFLPLPTGNRVAVIHYTGSGCVIAADACQKEGLELAEFSPATVEALREITPAWHRVRNPVDLWPAIERHWAETAYGVAIEALLDDEGVDSLIINLFAMPRWETYIPDFDLLRASGKPVLFCVEGNAELVREAVAKIEGQGFPVYSQVNRAIFALSHLSKHARFLGLT